MSEKSAPKRRFIDEVNGEEYLHKQVWKVVQRQINYAENNPKGALYDDMVAMVFASHSLEGYMNFLGDKIAPEIWEDERSHFRKTGMAGKLSKLNEICGLEAIKKGRRPYSTIFVLQRLRNNIAHPRTQKIKNLEVEYTEGKEPPMFRLPYLEKLVSHKKAIQAMEDVKAVIDQLHGAAVARFPDRALGADALGGFMSFHSSSSRLKE